MRTTRGWIKLVLVTATIGIAQVAVATAEAQLLYEPPWSNAAVDVNIGRRLSTNEQVIAWERRSDGACVVTVIGDSAGLFGNTLVRGTKFGDYIGVVEVASSLVCGMTVHPLVYNGHYLDIDGRDGADSLGAGHGDTYLFGGNGGDHLTTMASNAQLLGGAGNDHLSAASNTSHAESLFGNDGTDCLEDFSEGAAVFDCGANLNLVPFITYWDMHVTDRTPVNKVSCERAVSECPF